MPPDGRRLVRAGSGLAILYVLVALATSHLSSRPLLPLFDGFVPPTPYEWVKPPPERAGDNVVPKPTERQITLGPDGAPASNAASDDAQIIVGLNEKSVRPQPPDTSVTVRMVPADAGTLGPLPAGLRVVSNAYQVEVTYQPSRAALTKLAAKGTIALTAAEPGNRLLYSADGQTWQETPFRSYGQDNGVFTELDTVGWFVVATTSSAHSAAGGSGALKVVLLVIAGLFPIVGAMLVLTLPSPVPATPVARSGGPPAERRKRRR